MELKDIKDEVLNLKEKFTAFMAKFSEQPAQPPANPIEFQQATTADGMVLKYEGELKEGTSVSVVGADGAETPAEGAYTLEDGTVINCSGGVVTTVTMPATQEPASYDQKFSEMETSFDSKIAELSDKITKLTEQISGAVSLTQSAVESVGKFMAMTPEPTENKSAKTEKKDARENRLEQIKTLRKQS